MKFSVRFLVCAFALGQLASLAADIPPSIIEEIVAKVNGEIVTRGDLLHARQDMEELLKGQGLPAIAIENTVKEREKDILRDRIDRFLLIAKAKDLNITVDTE